MSIQILKMCSEVKNKVIVVTGGAQGIGYKIAENFIIKQAKRVIILDVNEELGNEAVQTLNAMYGSSNAEFMRCDVTKDLDEVFQVIIERYKQVDVLVNNAGVFNDKAVKMTIDTNVTSVVQWTLKFWEHMRQDKGGNGGTIINISSVVGFRTNQFTPIYQASKWAVLGFTKSVGHKNNYERTGVKLCAVWPGYTRTPLTAAENYKLWDDSLEACNREALNRHVWQEPDVVGGAVVEVTERADSGTVWVVEKGEPVKEVIFSTHCDK